MDLQNIAIKELLNNIGCLEALRALNVSGCSNLKKFPEIQRNMGSLHFLYISGNAIKKVSSSIGRLKDLQILRLSNCENLVTLPNSIGNLTTLEAFVFVNVQSSRNCLIA